MEGCREKRKISLSFADSSSKVGTKLTSCKHTFLQRGHRFHSY